MPEGLIKAMEIYQWVGLDGEDHDQEDRTIVPTNFSANGVVQVVLSVDGRVDYSSMPANDFMTAVAQGWLVPTGAFLEH